MSDDLAIAVDLGGTHIRVAVVSASGELSHRRDQATDAPEGPDAVIGRMADLVGAVADHAGLPIEIPIGVASPGPLDTRTGTVLFTPNLKGWRDVPLVDKLAAATCRRVALANDGNCGALGEARFGTAGGVHDLVYIALGTGIGGGIVTGGHLIDGLRGLAGEVGHVVVAMDGPRCTCGAIGCLESFAAGWAIKREAELVSRTADGEGILRVAAGRSLHAGVVGEAARQGDPAALGILGRAGRALGAAMGAFANLFNPSVFVIGGGVAHLEELLLDPPEPRWPTIRSSTPDVTSRSGTHPSVTTPPCTVLVPWHSASSRRRPKHQPPPQPPAEGHAILARMANAFFD